MNNKKKLERYVDFILDGKKITKENIHFTLEILQHVITHLSHRHEVQRFHKTKGMKSHNERKEQRKILREYLNSYLKKIEKSK